MVDLSEVVWLASGDGTPYGCASDEQQAQCRRLSRVVVQAVENTILATVYDEQLTANQLLCCHIVPRACCIDCHKNGKLMESALLDGRRIWLCCEAQAWLADKGFLANI